MTVWDDPKWIVFLIFCLQTYLWLFTLISKVNLEFEFFILTSCFSKVFVVVVQVKLQTAQNRSVVKGLRKNAFLISIQSINVKYELR